MKAKLGQNFLVSAEAQRAIADALGDVRNEAVLEIGPGKAAITEILAGRARLLVAIELDRTLAAALRTRFLIRNAEALRVQVLEQDVLTVDLTALAASLADADAKAPADRGKLAVVGNLPYYITSDILLHLFAHQSVISRAVLMVQREVADRIVAEPGTRDYGMLSATCQMYARAERLFTLPPEAFSPPPQVHSSVVRLIIAPRFAELDLEPAAFIAHLRTSFAQKRKTLANNLRAAGHGAPDVAAALNKAGIPALARSETLALEEQARLFHALRGNELTR